MDYVPLTVVFLKGPKVPMLKGAFLIVRLWRWRFLGSILVGFDRKVQVSGRVRILYVGAQATFLFILFLSRKMQMSYWFVCEFSNIISSRLNSYMQKNSISFVLGLQFLAPSGALISSVRSSNSHPDLLVITSTTTTPLFQIYTGPQHWTFTFWATTAI